MPGVVSVQNNRPSGMQTAMQGIQAYGAVNGIMNSNTQTDALSQTEAMKRRIMRLQNPAATGNDQTADYGTDSVGGK